MVAWTANDLLKWHLPHRLGDLSEFRNRFRSESHEAHCAMKDGAIVTCRVLWTLLGVRVDSTREIATHGRKVGEGAEAEDFSRQTRG